jgi:hypothetical protein
MTLAGVLYFHRISDFKMGGTSTRNFKMFRKLCGDTTLRNVIIVTNMWGVVDPHVGEAREAELIREEMFFKPVLDKGAQMARHENTVPSAERIIRLILNNDPLPLQIQMELVEEGKDISETSAGEELTRELNAQIKKYKEEVRTLKEEMKQAIKDKEEEFRGELETETKKMQREIARPENEAKTLEILEVRFTEVGEETKREAGRLHSLVPATDRRAQGHPHNQRRCYREGESGNAGGNRRTIQEANSCSQQIFHTGRSLLGRSLSSVTTYCIGRRSKDCFMIPCCSMLGKHANPSQSWQMHLQFSVHLAPPPRSRVLLPK